MERMRNKDLENAWVVQGIRQEKCAKLEEENKKLNEKVRFLEECLDRKEEVNRKLREECRLRDTQYGIGEPVISSGPCL